MSDEEDGKVIDLADAVSKRLAEADEPELETFSFDDDVDVESLAWILKDDQAIILIGDIRNKVAMTLTPTQARILGHQLLRLGTIANLVFEDESGTLDWLLEPEEL